MAKKNGEEKSLSTTASSADESLPKVNPIKWTVIKLYHIYIHMKKYILNTSKIIKEIMCFLLCR